MSSTNWKHISGSLHQITCKGANVVGCIHDKDQSVYQLDYNTDTLIKLPGVTNVVWAAAGIDYSVWCCDATKEVHRWNAVTSKWDKMPAPPGGCVQIDAWTYNRAVCVNAKQELFEFGVQVHGWNKIPAVAGTHFTMGANGEKWHINTAGSVYRKAGQSNWQQMPGKLKSIHCTDGNNVAGVDAANKIYRWNPSISNWTQLSGLATHVGITWGNMWHVNVADDVYQAFI